MHSTQRLQLVRPETRHLDALFETASDAEVTRWVGWPRHSSREDTKSFLAFSDAEWDRAPAGPLVIEERETGDFLGTTGLAFEGPQVASTGYVLGRSHWGRGYATEALLGVVELADRLGVIRLFALCHPHHHASSRVLEKAGFDLEGVLRRSTVFPNQAPLPGQPEQTPQDACVYARILSAAG